MYYERNIYYRRKAEGKAVDKNLERVTLLKSDRNSIWKKY